MQVVGKWHSLIGLWRSCLCGGLKACGLLPQGHHVYSVTGPEGGGGSAHHACELLECVVVPTSMTMWIRVRPPVKQKSGE